MVLILIQQDLKIRKSGKTLLVRILTLSRGSARLNIKAPVCMKKIILLFIQTG